MARMKESETASPGFECPKAEIIIGQELVGKDIVDHTVKVRLMGRKLHLLRCWNGEQTERGVEQGGIVLPDKSADTSWWYTILAVSPDCRYYKPEHVGGRVKLTDNGSIGNMFTVGPAERVVKEDWLESRTDNPFCVIMET